MSQAKGAKGRVVLGYETAYGATPGSPVGSKLPFNSIDVKGAPSINTPTTITGTRNPAQPSRGFQDVTGSLTVPMDLNAIGFWLKGLLGDPSTTGAADPYTHVFKVSDEVPSIFLEKGFTDIAEYSLFNGVKLGSFKMSFGGDGELVASIGVMGAKETVSGSPVDATPDEISLERVNNFQASIKEGGVTLATCTSGEISLDNGLDGDSFVLGGGGVRGDIAEGIMAVSGSITTLFTDSALLDKAIAGTETSLELTLTVGSHSLKFEFPELTLVPASPAIEGPAGVKQTLQWNGYHQNDADSSAVIVTLVNGQADY